MRTMSNPLITHRLSQRYTPKALEPYDTSLHVNSGQTVVGACKLCGCVREIGALSRENPLRGWRAECGQLTYPDAKGEPPDGVGRWCAGYIEPPEIAELAAAMLAAFKLGGVEAAREVYVSWR